MSQKNIFICSVLSIFLQWTDNLLLEEKEKDSLRPHYFSVLSFFFFLNTVLAIRKHCTKFPISYCVVGCVVDPGVSPLTTPQFITSKVQRRFNLLVCVVWIKGSTRALTELFVTQTNEHKNTV